MHIIIITLDSYFWLVRFAFLHLKLFDTFIGIVLAVRNCCSYTSPAYALQVTLGSASKTLLFCNLGFG